jgi:hypothetical protein
MPPPWIFERHDGAGAAAAARPAPVIEIQQKLSGWRLAMSSVIAARIWTLPLLYAASENGLKQTGATAHDLCSPNWF